MNFTLFPAFFDKPDAVHFSEVEDNETVEIFLRQHWITTTGWVNSTIILLIVPPLALSFNRLFFRYGLSVFPTDLIVSAIVYGI